IGSSQLGTVYLYIFFFFFQAEDGIRDFHVTGVQTCALPILGKDTILFAFDEFIIRFEKMVEKGLRSYDTLKHWRTTKKKVEAFLVHKYRAKDLALSKIDPSFGDQDRKSVV